MKLASWLARLALDAIGQVVHRRGDRGTHRTRLLAGHRGIEASATNRGWLMSWPSSRR